MRKNTSQNRQVRRTQEWILGSLFLLMERESLEKITISDLVEKAGVSRQAFYRNYNRKEDVIAGFFDQMFLEFESATRQTRMKTSEPDIYQIFFETVYAHKRELMILARPENGYLLFQNLWRFNAFFLNRLSERQNDPNPADEEAYFVRYQLGGIIGTALEWISRGLQESPGQVGGFLDVITTAFRQRDGYLPQLL